MDDIDNISSGNSDSDPEHTRRKREIREKIDHTLNRLSARQRMIFILRHYQQLNTKEIAECLKCTEGSVKKQLFRAVQVIKQHLKSFVMEKDYELQKI